MLNYDSVIVRYGEISLKGSNRKVFETSLANDIKKYLELQKINFNSVNLRRGRIYIDGLTKKIDLSYVLGIYSYSPALKIKKELEDLFSEVKKFIPFIKNAQSFRVNCQRVDKKFPHTSVEIERKCGAILHLASGCPVNLKNPDITVEIEIGEKNIYIFGEKIKAYSGFPYGSAGKLAALFSAGIDSAVAVFLMMKRGVAPILIHFKVTDEEEEKVKKLKDILQGYTCGREIPLIIIKRNDLFDGKFTSIYNDRNQSPYLCVLCKALMHKMAGKIAKEHNAMGLITGDNLAQVASQTLDNMRAYHHLSELPVYSPLIAFEKLETIDWAKKIGTYEVSSKQVPACNPPKFPKTKVSVTMLEQLLTKHDFD